MFKRLHPLYEIEGAIGTESGVNEVSAAEIQNDVVETGVDNKVEAEPNNYEKAFAKRLAAKEAEWEAKNAEKYKDYELHKEMSEYLSELNGGIDPLSLKERRELERLHERAEKENVPPEVLKRIDQLEAEAAEGKALKTQQEQQQQYQTFRSGLEKFAIEKGIQADDLHKFMHENQFPSDKIELAYKAMKADELESKQSEFEASKEQFEKDAIKKYLDSKKAPKAEGKGAAGIQGQGRPGSWQAADARFKARIEAANKSV